MRVCICYVYLKRCMAGVVGELGGMSYNCMTEMVWPGTHGAMKVPWRRASTRSISRDMVTLIKAQMKL